MNNIKQKLPQGWIIKRLGEICKLQLGKTPHRKTASFWDKDRNTKNIWISISDMQHGKELFESKEYVSDIGAESINITPTGTLLLSFKLTLGRVSFAGTDLYTNEAIASLIDLSDKIDKKYLFYYFTFFDWHKAAEGDVKVKGKTLNKAKLKNLDIVTPPLTEQKRIVAILDKAFEAIDKAKTNAEQNLKNAKELFDSYLQEVFENKGEDWKEKRLGKIAHFKNGMNYTKSSKGQTIEIIGVKDFKNNFWVPLKELEKVTIDGELSEQYLIKKGDIVVVRSNGNPKLIGRTLLVNNVNEAISYSGFTIRIRLHSENILPLFLCHYLKTGKIREELINKGNGVGIKSLNQKILSVLNIPFPPVKQQEVIVEKLNHLSLETQKLEKIYKNKIEDLEELKKSILQKAFNGEL